MTNYVNAQGDSLLLQPFEEGVKWTYKAAKPRRETEIGGGLNFTENIHTQNKQEKFFVSQRWFVWILVEVAFAQDVGTNQPIWLSCAKQNPTQKSYTCALWNFFVLMKEGICHLRHSAVLALRLVLRKELGYQEPCSLVVLARNM